MFTVTPAEEAQLAQDVVMTVLGGALHRPGAKHELALRAGLSTIHLSYILHGWRMPSREMAKRLAAHIPLSEADRRDWLSQVHRYWDARQGYTTELVQTLAEDGVEAVARVRQAHLQTLYTADEAKTRLNCLHTLSIARPLIQIFPRDAHPVAYLDLCGLMHEMYSLLDRQVAAAAIAKHAAFMSSIFQPKSGIDLVRDLRMHQLNSARLEAVSLYHLGLYKAAYERSLAIEADEYFPVIASYLLPPLYWDRLNAMACMPRSSVREAQQLAHSAWAVSDQDSTGWGPIARLLVSRAYAEVCITHRKHDEADAILAHEAKDLDAIPHIGPLHKVMFMRTCARLAWERSPRNWERWRMLLFDALVIAGKAGLHHQIREIVEDYGQQQPPTTSFE